MNRKQIIGLAKWLKWLSGTVLLVSLMLPLLGAVRDLTVLSEDTFSEVYAESLSLPLTLLFYNKPLPLALVGWLASIIITSRMGVDGQSRIRKNIVALVTVAFCIVVQVCMVDMIVGEDYYCAIWWVPCMKSWF